MISALGTVYDKPVVAEIGVALGDFSEVMLKSLEPSEFVAFDLFTMHEWESVWGRPAKQIFNGKTHLDFYKDRFRGSNVRTIIGKSDATLLQFPDQYFDVIYVDADHVYEGVKADAYLSDKKLKPDGTLIFNDYIMYDHAADIPYGVVQAVNELIVGREYQVVGFALEMNMFCDIAIRRKR